VQILTYSGAFAPIKNPVWGHSRWASSAKHDPVFFPDILRVFGGATTPFGGVGRSRESGVGRWRDSCR